jgi:hypothetical protein
MSSESRYHDLISLRNALDLRLKQLEWDLKRMAGDIPAQVEKRKALAQSLDLSRRLMEMYEPVQNSPSWTKAGSSLIVDPLSNVVSKREGQIESLEFEHNRRSYSLRLRRTTPAEARDEAELGTGAAAVADHTLLSFCDARGIPLFAVSLEEVQEARGRVFRAVDIEAFIPGDWIKDFLELSEEIVVLQKEMELRKKYDPSELEKLKKHFGL